MAMFMEFHEGTLPLKSLNFGTIILLPKKKDVKVIKQSLQEMCDFLTYLA
jgi:hypothetical protein